MELNLVYSIVRNSNQSIVLTGKLVSIRQYDGRGELYRFENDKGDYELVWLSQIGADKVYSVVSPELAPKYQAKSKEELGAEEIGYHSTYQGGR